MLRHLDLEYERVVMYHEDQAVLYLRAGRPRTCWLESFEGVRRHRDEAGWNAMPARALW